MKDVTSAEAARPAGSARTRAFYEEVGWRVEDGRPVDLHLFGLKEEGPIRRMMHERQEEAVRAAVRLAGRERVRLVEVGCGGSPAVFLAELCERFTAVDFSASGLARAGERLSATGLAFETVEADACHLPLDSGAYDAAFSSNMLYHIPDPRAQERAIDEILRVVRPGGVAVFVLDNPFPLLFPVRLLRRVVARTPVVSAAVDALRKRPPLPYLPMRIGWVKRRLRRWGEVSVRVNGLPTVWFNQHVSEHRPATRLLWRGAWWMERAMPRVSAYAGASYLAVVRKRAGEPR